MIAKAEIGQYIENLGAKTSSPGGGAVAAVTGAQSIGLIEMVCQFTPENEHRERDYDSKHCPTNPNPRAKNASAWRR